jgi:hypothetical protein
MIHPNLRLAAGLLVGLSLASCGLISSDVTNFDLTLPDKKFTIDTGGWQVDQTAANLYLMQSCTTGTPGSRGPAAPARRADPRSRATSRPPSRVRRPAA